MEPSLYKDLSTAEQAAIIVGSINRHSNKGLDVSSYRFLAWDCHTDRDADRATIPGSGGIRGSTRDYRVFLAPRRRQSTQ